MVPPPWTRALARQLVRKLGFGIIAVLGACARLAFPARTLTRGPKQVLLIRLDLLGDVARTMWLAAGLRAAFPDARLTVLTLPYTAQLAALCPAVDDVVSIDTNGIRTPRGILNPNVWRSYVRTWRWLRAQEFDLAVSTFGAMASLWARLSGAARRVGYAGEAYPFLLTDTVPGRRYRERRHEVEYLQDLATAIGAGELRKSTSPVVPDSAAGERIAASCGAAPRQPVVVVHPGSVNGAAKRWPTRNWALFCDQLQEAGARVILVGSSAEVALVNEVVALAGTPVASLAGRTDVGELAALLARAALVAGGDSGPVHLAATLGRPTLAVYGPTDPVTYGPRGPATTRVLTADLPCSPCYAATAPAECPLGDPICMRLISVGDMVDAAKQVLLNADGNSTAWKSREF